MQWLHNLSVADATADDQWRVHRGGIADTDPDEHRDTDRDAHGNSHTDEHEYHDLNGDAHGDGDTDGYGYPNRNSNADNRGGVLRVYGGRLYDEPLLRE